MLEIKNLTKKFGDFTAVNNENMTIQDGEILGLIGQNGAGKSTTFKMILNFIEPNEGTILWNGKPITTDIQDDIGFLPEERGLDVNMTAEQQILYFAELHGMKRKEASAQIDSWFDRLDVRGKKTDKIKKLSKGNQQKIQIITTLLHKPKFLILDEPFSGLDPVNSSLLMNEIKNAAKDGASVIYSSHDMNNVSEIADSILMLVKGETVLNGKLSDVRLSYGRTRLYLESDVTDSQLMKYKGVTKIEKTGLGRTLILDNEEVGKKIFDLVTKKGYITAFDQQPPTLDEIFRFEIDTFGGK